jgi:hypothetical protein
MQPNQTQSHSDFDTAPQKRYDEWPYYLPPDNWIINSNSHLSSLHWTNFSPTVDWTAIHQEIFTRQTGRPGSEMVRHLVHKDPISNPTANPVPFFEMIGPRTLVSSAQSNNFLSSIYPSSSHAGPSLPVVYPTPSPCFAQVPSTGREDTRFLLYRYAQYATGKGRSSCDETYGSRTI